jgi:predicted O-methyltransferase YrrM
MNLREFIDYCRLGQITAGHLPTGRRDMQGWNSTHQIFASLIQKLKPATIIEVGTWKGASAIHMANLQRDSGIEGTILCIDTWFGGSQAYTDQKYLNDTLPRGACLPMLGIFLENICQEGLQDHVFAMPSTAGDAAEQLRLMKVKADLVYIDANHEERDVWRDLVSYWPLARNGGVLFGDDYDPQYFPGLIKAVTRFSERIGIPVEEHTGKFVFRKPALGPGRKGAKLEAPKITPA